MVVITAWEGRDQATDAEDYYNHPLRIKNRTLQTENTMLKRLLRENGIDWPGPYASVGASSQGSNSYNPDIPFLPPEVMLRILSYAVTSRWPIIDPLCKTTKEHRTVTENGAPNQIAISFLSTCKAYHAEGQKMLWANNSFIFTSVNAIRSFAEIKLSHREVIQQVTFRIIARFYDDEDRTHKLLRTHHKMMDRAIRLKVTKRPKEPTLARRGFRSYAWFQLIDFLEALQPPHDPTVKAGQPRKTLLPNLKKLRIDLVNFGHDMLAWPPHQLHDVAAHQLGCSLNELIVTGLPRDDAGYRTGAELCGLLKDDGLFIDHEPTFVALKNFVRHLPGDHMHTKVVRSMRPAKGVAHHHHDDYPNYFDEFVPAPPDEGEPPFSVFLSCRTIWKKIPVQIDRPDVREWCLFDRVTGLPWSEVAEEATLLDEMRELGESDDEDGMLCENCGEFHPGALLSDDEMMDDLYGDL